MKAQNNSLATILVALVLIFNVAFIGVSTWAVTRGTISAGENGLIILAAITLSVSLFCSWMLADDRLKHVKQQTEYARRSAHYARLSYELEKTRMQGPEAHRSVRTSLSEQPSPVNTLLAMFLLIFAFLRPR